MRFRAGTELTYQVAGDTALGVHSAEVTRIPVARNKRPGVSDPAYFGWGTTRK